MPHFARSSRRTVRHWPNGGVSYYDCRVEVHRSARKHGISDDDIHTAAQQYLIAYTIDDDQPPRELRLGFDTRGRPSRRTVRHWPNGGVSYYDCRVEVHRSAIVIRN